MPRTRQINPSAADLLLGNTRQGRHSGSDQKTSGPRLCVPFWTRRGGGNMDVHKRHTDAVAPFRYIKKLPYRHFLRPIPQISHYHRPPRGRVILVSGALNVNQRPFFKLVTYEPPPTHTHTRFPRGGLNYVAKI